MLVNIHFSKYDFGNPCCSFKKAGLSTTYMCITLFCTFLCRQCTTTMWKCLIPRFVERETYNTRKQLAEIWRTERDSEFFKVWSSENSLFKWRFCSCHCRCCLYKLPFFEWLERGVKMLQVLHQVWLMSYRYLSFSSQIWYLRKWLFPSIGLSKDMRVKGFNFLLVYMLVPSV